MPEKCYKVLKNGKSCHGGQQDWPLPTPAGPGEWLEHVGRLSPCHSGYHLTRLPAVWYTGSGLDVYEAEYAGEHDASDDDKIVCRKVRLIKKLTEEELVAVRVYLSGSHAAKEGKVAASGSATVEASGSATVEAYGSATVRAYDSATVAASGSATVEAYGSATVRAYGSATVRASGSATVAASGSATVRASGSATVEAYGSATVEASGFATVLASSSATVRASDSATVEASGSATVEASGAATVAAYDSATVEASGSATVEAYGSATVRASDSATVEASDSATVEASGSATVRASGSATVLASGFATVEASDSATVEASDSATVNSYSKLNRIGLHSLAVEIDRSQPRVVVRHAANAAVMLEAANTQQGDAITKSEGAQMLTFGRQKQALANSLPVLEALADANVVTKGLDTSSRVKWSQEAERLVKLILASMEEEALLETNGVSTLEEAECASCGHEIKKGDGHYYVPGKGIEPTCCLGCWQEVVKQQTA